MGSVFAFTQYLQFAHGFSALEAGAAMLPLALGLVIGSGASNHLADRFGRTRVIAGGLIGVAARPEHEPRLDAGHGAAAARASSRSGSRCRWAPRWRPRPTSVMSAVPEAKAGVGSAMSDVTRQVGGALGVAVIGSIIATAYSRDMAGAPDAAASRSAPPTRVAEQVGGAAGRELADAAGQAFTDALGIGLTAAAVVALAGALLVLLRLPERADANHDADGDATAPDHPAAAERLVTTPNVKGTDMRTAGGAPVQLAPRAQTWPSMDAGPPDR